MVKYNSDEIFAALGNPVRRQMTERLSHVQRLSISELAQPFALSLPAALKHVGILEQSGIVVCTKEGRVKYCAVNLEALEQGFDWFRSQEKFWEASLDRLGRHLDGTIIHTKN